MNPTTTSREELFSCTSTLAIYPSPVGNPRNSAAMASDQLPPMESSMAVRN